MYIGINVLVYGNAWWWILGPWQRKHSVLKINFLLKMLYFLKNKSLTKFVGELIEAPNILNHITRNIGATIKASWKTAHGKVFFILGQKGHLFKNSSHHQKTLYP